MAVLEVNRDKVRNLGITLPQSFGLTPQISNASTTTTSGTTTTTTGTTSTATGTQNLTLNNLANINATNFAVSITGGTVNALLTDSDTRILQNPRIRSTDGQRATLKIGSKIPIATGSYNAGVSTGVAFHRRADTVHLPRRRRQHRHDPDRPPEPRDLPQDEGRGLLAVRHGHHLIGVSEPIISQRVSDQVIQLQDGEPSILAGIITHQDNKTVSGTPFLGEIPFFKYLFSTQSKETQQDEIVFLLIPHIVRESVLTRLNTAAIDTGTSTSIELRHDETPAPQPGADLGDPGLNRPGQSAPGSPTTAANAASAMLQQLHQQAAPPTPGQRPYANTPPVMSTPAPGTPLPPNTAPVNTAPGGPISFNVVPSSPSQVVGGTFSTSVLLNGGQDVYSVPLQVQFDPKVLQLVNVDAGDLLARDGKIVTVVHREDNGLATISASRPPQATGISGSGAVCTLTFKAIAPGDTHITLAKVGAKNSQQTNLPATGGDTLVHVR